MAATDRMTGPLRAIARRADPLSIYRFLYRGRLVAQSADLRLVDVMVEDADGIMPPLSRIPLRHGIPGASVQLAPGASVLVGWENGKPTHPFAGLWASPVTKGGKDARGEPGGGDVLAIILNGLVITLGAPSLVPVLDGVLTGQSIDPYTGMPHWMLGNGSTKVLAAKE